MGKVASRSALWLLIGGLFLVLARPAVAEEVYVAPGESVQAAIDGACAGSVIVLLGYTYEESISVAKPVNLRGRQVRPPVTWDLAFDPFGIQETAEAPWTRSQVARILGSVRVSSPEARLENLVILSSDGIAATVSGGSVVLLNCVFGSATGSALSIENGAEVSIVSSSAYLSLGDGIHVGEGCSLVATDCVIALNELNGIVVDGSAVLERCLIAWNGHCKPFWAWTGNCPEDVGYESGVVFSGVDASNAERLSIQDSWVFANHGFGVAAVELKWNEFEEPQPLLQGINNMLPGRTEPFGNTLGALHPDPEDIRSRGTAIDEVPWAWAWPPDFRAREFAADVEFLWTYRGKAFSLNSTIVVPLALPGPSWERWSAPDFVSDVLDHYSNHTELRGVSAELLRLAAVEGYSRLATASFILGFVNANIAYDYDRYQNNEHGFQLPVQTLAMRSGVCRDTAALTTVLLHLAGFDAAYVGLAPRDEDGDGHAVVGLALDGAWGTSLEHDGRTYYLAQTGPPLSSMHSSCEFGDVDLEKYGAPYLWEIDDVPDVVTEVCWFAPDDPREGLGYLRITNGGSATAEDVQFCHWWGALFDFDYYTGNAVLDCENRTVIGDLLPGEWRDVLISTDGAPACAVQRTDCWSEGSGEALYVLLEVAGNASAYPDSHFYSATYHQSQCRSP